MDWFKKWAEREYSDNQRAIAVIFGGITFWIVIPAFILIGSSYIDRWLYLPKFVYGYLNQIIALIFIVPGWIFANWTVQVQYSLGRGTPIPLLPTQELIIKRPYTCCRNPMALGTTIFYLGLAIWSGSLSAIVLALFYPSGISLYIKLIEERELEERFGFEYVEYKRTTPFLIPRFVRKDSGKDH